MEDCGDLSDHLTLFQHINFLSVPNLKTSKHVADSSTCKINVQITFVKLLHEHSFWLEEADFNSLDQKFDDLLVVFEVVNFLEDPVVLNLKDFES